LSVSEIRDHDGTAPDSLPSVRATNDDTDT
jgi:hypothetical protein